MKRADVRVKSVKRISKSKETRLRVGPVIQAVV